MITFDHKESTSIQRRPYNYTYDSTEVLDFHLSFKLKMLLWQNRVATTPRIFVIATCIRLGLTVYLLISWNKQLFARALGARHLCCLYIWEQNRKNKENVTCKDRIDTVLFPFVRELDYYNVPNGKWSILIKYMLQ